MSVGKRLTTDEPLTEHDVAERLDRACLRVWRILLDVEQLGDEFRQQVRTSRYLSDAPREAHDALARLLEPTPPGG